MKRFSMNLVAATLAMASCSSTDHGALTNRAGESLRPQVLPWTVCHGVDMPGWAVDAAAEWWAEQLDGEQLFDVNHDPACYYSMDLPQPGLRPPGIILVSVAYALSDSGDTPWDEDIVPWGDALLGEATLWWYGRDISAVNITINPEVVENRRWLVGVLCHELGHALALADDPRYSGSVMASPTWPGWPLTEQDRGIVLEEANGGR